MTTVNIHEAKTQLSRLIQRAVQGEEIIIARGGNPIAKLVPLKQPSGQRPLGIDAGRIKISDDFDAPLDEFADYMR